MKSIEDHQKEIEEKLEANGNDMKQKHEIIINNIEEMKDDITNSILIMNNNFISTKDITEKNEENILQKCDEVLEYSNIIKEKIEDIQNKQSEYKEKLDAITTLNQVLINKMEESRKGIMFEFETIKRKSNGINHKVESINSKITNVESYTTIISDTI
jgi:hypothetical protein